MVDRIPASGELFLDGVKLPSEGDFEIMPKHGERETLEDNVEIHGYTEKTIYPYIKGKVIFKSLAVFEMVEKAIDSTVALKADNGKTYVLKGAFRNGSMGSISISDKAAYEVEFKGSDLTES